MQETRISETSNKPHIEKDSQFNSGDAKNYQTQGEQQNYSRDDVRKSNDTYERETLGE